MQSKEQVGNIQREISSAKTQQQILYSASWFLSFLPCPFVSSSSSLAVQPTSHIHTNIFSNIISETRAHRKFQRHPTKSAIHRALACAFISQNLYMPKYVPHTHRMETVANPHTHTHTAYCCQIKYTTQWRTFIQLHIPEVIFSLQKKGKNEERRKTFPLSCV